MRNCPDCLGTGNGNVPYSGSPDISDYFECPRCEGEGKITDIVDETDDYLDAIKRYDDSVWLYFLQQRTVFDTGLIKRQKDWLIAEVERLRAENTLLRGEK